MFACRQASKHWRRHMVAIFARYCASHFHLNSMDPKYITSMAVRTIDRSQQGQTDRERGILFGLQCTMSRCVLWNVCRKLMLHMNLDINALDCTSIGCVTFYTNIFACILCFISVHLYIICMRLLGPQWAKLGRPIYEYTRSRTRTSYSTFMYFVHVLLCLNYNQYLFNKMLSSARS